MGRPRAGQGGVRPEDDPWNQLRDGPSWPGRSTWDRSRYGKCGRITLVEPPAREPEGGTG